jgi:hypothetical protein
MANPRPDLWYKFDESAGAANAIDSSGNGRTGTPFNGLTFGAVGKRGKAASFDGVNDYLRATLWTYPTAFTMLAWINTPNVVATRVICNNHSNTNGITIYVDISNILTVQIWSAGAQITTSVALATGTFKHVAVVYNGSVSIYVDGVLAAGPTAATLGASNQDFLVGANDPNAPANTFSGLIDDFRFYPAALPVAQIISIFRGTKRRYRGRFPQLPQVAHALRI